MKEQITKILNYIWKTIQELVNIIVIIIRWVFEPNQAQPNTLTEKEKLYLAVDIMMHQMSIDLYRAFHFHGYNLSPIEHVESIRLHNWKLQNSIFFYQFTLEKKSDGKISNYLLNKMKNDMNTDIVRARTNTLYSEGEEFLYYTYPFLYHGITVISVEDSGFVDIIVTVSSQLTPQKFIETYRQNLL